MLSETAWPFELSEASGDSEGLEDSKGSGDSEDLEGSGDSEHSEGSEGSEDSEDSEGSSTLEIFESSSLRLLASACGLPPSPGSRGWGPIELVIDKFLLVHRFLHGWLSSLILSLAFLVEGLILIVIFLNFILS